MKPLAVLGAVALSAAMAAMCEAGLPSGALWFCPGEPLPDCRNRKLVFLVELDALGGFGPLHSQLLELWNRDGVSALEGAEGVLLVTSPNALFTKRAAQTVVYLANRMGCRFPGHCMVESLEGLTNFSTWQKTLDMSLEEIRAEQCRRLFQRFMSYEPPRGSGGILALHASSNRTSNTLMLWQEVQRHLPEGSVATRHIENGSVVDCKGCDFVTCIHYAQQKSCFYGGLVTQEVLPAIEAAQIVVFISPNYNDALSAMHTALINRLTALYRRMPLYEKRFYGVIVSGNSGSDSLACQMIGALNLNKGMDLPPRFALTGIANDPGSILKMPDFHACAAAFAQAIRLEAGML